MRPSDRTAGGASEGVRGFVKSLSAVLVVTAVATSAAILGLRRSGATTEDADESGTPSWQATYTRNFMLAPKPVPPTGVGVPAPFVSSNGEATNALRSWTYTHYPPIGGN